MSLLSATTATISALVFGADMHEDTLELTPFYADQMVLITPVNEHFLRFFENGGITLEEICREPMLLREKGSGSKKCISSYFERVGVDENDLIITARLNDQESIKNLVAGGLGISIISEKAAEDAVKAGRLLTFPLPEAGARRYLYVACRRYDAVPGGLRTERNPRRFFLCCCRRFLLRLQRGAGEGPRLFRGGL